MERDEGTISFPHRHFSSTCRLQNLHVPEQAVAYDETYALQTLQRYGLDPESGVRYGNWCGRTRHLSYQDVVVVRKARPLSWTQRASRWLTRLAA
jgi:hypothetical protein